MIENFENTIKIISQPSEENPFLVIYKPHGIPSAPLNEEDKDNAFYYVSTIYPQIKDVHGKKYVEGGLVHRIDTLTDGLLLIACKQHSYDFFENEQKEGRFIKYYRAECDYIKENASILSGFPPLNQEINAEEREACIFTLESFFRPFGEGRKSVRPVLENSTKAALKKSGSQKYKTEIKIVKSKSDFYAECRIINGYRHQVRCHLAWCGFPVKGDVLYNAKASGDFKFTAYSLEFIHPLTGKTVSFKI